MMRKHNPQLQEDGFHLLLPHAADFIDDLLREFQLETMDHGLRCWLLELIVEAADARALNVLVEQLRSQDDSLRDWAILGLRELDTHEARKAPYHAGVPKLPRDDTGPAEARWTPEAEHETDTWK